MNPVETVARTKCELGEGPLWDSRQNALLWTDIEGRQIWRYSTRTGETDAFLAPEMRVGGFALTEDGAMILCADKGVFRLDAPDATPDLLWDPAFTDNEKFNDITTDPRGRIFAGTLCPGTGDGKLYRLERGCEPAVVLTGLGCSNGMTFSLDEQVFYHTDSMEYRITRYRYDVDTGEIRDPEVFFQGTEEQGLPDGLTIDMDGCLWSAAWGVSCVRKLDGAGRIVDEVPTPAVNTTSVMFGGESLSDLFITSALSEGNELGGALFRLKTTTRGRPEYPAAF